MKSALALLVCAAAAAADTGPSLLLRPWGEERKVEVKADIEAYFDGRVRRGAPLDLRRYEVDGRARAGREAAVGFDALHLDLDSSDPSLPNRFVETRVAVGVPLGAWRGWRIDGLAGFGHASDEPLADGKGWHGLATVMGRYEVRRGTSWLVALSYDGNRSIFPDVPLPLVAYQRFFGPKLRFSVGFPFNSVTWKPAPRWTVEVQGIPPIFLEGGVTFAAREDLDLFVRYDNRRDAFHLDGTSGNRRVFFRQRRVEAGARWRSRDGLELTLAAGYAFDQVFTFGFDVRNDDTTLARLDDAAYVRVAVSVTFGGRRGAGGPRGGAGASRRG